jgi:hypothetical protein
MKTPHDPELEQFKRSIDLVEYAKKAGYEPSQLSAGPGVRLFLLDHPSGDRVVVAQRPSGDWIYAAVPGYAPRVAGESAEHALARLRASVDGSADKGSIVEFVQRLDGRTLGGDAALERVREQLREYCATGRAVGFDAAAPSPTSTGSRDEPTMGQSERQQSDRQVPPPGPAPLANPELNRRRYDWTPPPSLPTESELEKRLERWGRAQAAIDEGQKGLRAGQDSPPHPPTVGQADRAPTPDAPPTHPSRDLAPNANSGLGKCRVDWTPSAADLEALNRALRSRSSDRGR